MKQAIQATEALPALEECGDARTLQDEPVEGLGAGDVSPEADAEIASPTVKLRAERMDPRSRKKWR